MFTPSAATTPLTFILPLCEVSRLRSPMHQVSDLIKLCRGSKKPLNEPDDERIATQR